jgi:hypothetical protein
VAVGKNAATWLVGRFLSGVSGAAFLSVAGGSVSDLFRGHALSTPMAVYSASPFLGPVMYVRTHKLKNIITDYDFCPVVQLLPDSSTNTLVGDGRGTSRSSGQLSS